MSRKIDGNAVITTWGKVMFNMFYNQEMLYNQCIYLKLSNGNTTLKERKILQLRQL